jgi:hypothetical protein
MSDIANSPFMVPIAAFIAWAVVMAIKTNASYKVRKLQSQERLLAIEKGVALPPEIPFEEGASSHTTPAQSAARRVARLRTSGIVCLSLGIGTFLFFVMLAHVLHVRPVLCGAASGLIPMAIGVGLLIDARLQGKSLKEDAEREAAASATSSTQAQPPAGYLE